MTGSADNTFKQSHNVLLTKFTNQNDLSIELKKILYCIKCLQNFIADKI